MNPLNEPNARQPSELIQVELIKAISELVEQLKKPQIPADDELWDAANIASYLKLSLDTTERQVTSRPDFPKPLQPCYGKRAAKRWFSGDVRKWARLNKESLPIGRKPRQSSRAATSSAVAL